MRSIQKLSTVGSRLRDAPFLKSVLTMLSGTLVAQAIPLAMSPVLARLYQPSDYGEYALFMLVAYAISALASLRYEYAIMLPGREEDAASIVVLCFWIAASVSALVGLGALAIGRIPVQNRSVAVVAEVGPLVALMVMLQSGYQTLTYWTLRQQRFGQLSISRVGRAVTMAVANVGFAFAGMSKGLIVSSLLGQGVATLLLGFEVLRSSRKAFLSVSWTRMRSEARAHRDFALYALPADLLSTGAQQLPVVVLGPSFAGMFSFVQNVVNAPLSFVSGSVLDAFKERATRDYRERREFVGIFVQLLRWLIILGVVPALALFAFGPEMFALAFGAPWREAGEFARILAPAIFMKFVVSPLSYSYYVAGRQKEDLVLHVGIAVLAAGALAAGEYWFASERASLVMFSGSYVLIYAIYLVRSYQFASGR